VGKDDAATILRKIRKEADFAPIWSYHAQYERLPEYLETHGIDKLSVERVVRTGAIGKVERDIRTGHETVHVGGKVDGENVDVVVGLQSVGGIEFARIVTIKPKAKRKKR
jgi:hypothetical protein